MVPYLHVTSHVDGHEHPHMLYRVGGRGFPTLVVMNADGDVLAKHSGARTVDGFRATIAQARDMEALRAADDRTPEQEAQVLLNDLNHGNLSVDEAEALDFEGLPQADELVKARAGLLARSVLGVMYDAMRAEDVATMEKCMSTLEKAAADDTSWQRYVQIYGARIKAMKEKKEGGGEGR